MIMIDFECLILYSRNIKEKGFKQRKRKMLFQHRKEKILKRLAQKGTVSIQELEESIGVSESTLRRDLVALEKEGLLKRVHGGATTINHLNKEQKMAQKETINQPAKNKIAKYVCSLIKKDSQIYIDAGTTTLELVRLLPTDKNLKLVTNGVDHALLALTRGIEVTLLGGAVKRNTHAIADMTAYKQLSKINFSASFMGMNGLHENQGLTTTNIDEATLKECAMNQSQNVYLLMDDTKIGQVYEFKVDLPAGAKIFINQEATTKHPQKIKNLKIKYDLEMIE